ncbi:unnamed protein product [Rotaria socialis]|uniref:Serine aminopeptidase S33 domain-containing protein n=1 Tax=Rotaria socialis TaxID=392032 RepID=A0A821CA20_9BILA|nr:unnamed protein product [Rotaria socialis]CAF4606826.1 unnamed protein product [Rotaria socialis]
MNTFSLLSHDGLSLAGYHWPTKNTKSPYALLILIHGFAEHSLRYEHLVECFTKHNVAIVAMDLRGHGQSGGQHVFIPSIEAIFQDIDLLIKKAKTIYPLCRTILYGHSMGGSLVLAYTLDRFLTKAHLCPYQALIVASPWIRLARPFQPPRPVFSVIRTACRLHPSMNVPLRFDPSKITRDQDIINSYGLDESVRRSGTLSLARHAGGMAAKLDRIHAVFYIPVLIQHGEADSITCHRASLRFSQRGQNIDYMGWPNCYHELHSEPEREDIFNFTLRWIGEKLFS